MSIFSCPGIPKRLNQTSDPSPENPRLRSRFPGVNSGGDVGRQVVELSRCPTDSTRRRAVPLCRRGTPRTCRQAKSRRALPCPPNSSRARTWRRRAGCHPSLLDVEPPTRRPPRASTASATHGSHARATLGASERHRLHGRARQHSRRSRRSRSGRRRCLAGAASDPLPGNGSGAVESAQVSRRAAPTSPARARGSSRSSPRPCRRRNATRPVNIS